MICGDPNIVRQASKVVLNLGEEPWIRWRQKKEKEITGLRSRVRELEKRVEKLSYFADVVKKLVNIDAEDLYKCVVDAINGKNVEVWCALAIHIVDLATEAVTTDEDSVSSILVDLWEKDGIAYTELVTRIEKVLQEKL